MLKTKSKMALARGLSRAIMAPRHMLGLGSEVRVDRGGIDWRLNLEEGIDLAIYLFGAFERSTQRAFARLIKPGDVVLDVGANIGAHTLRLAEAVRPTGKVIAVEPTEYAFRRLTQLLTDNPSLARVVVAKQMLLSSPERLALPATIYSRWSLVQGGDEQRHEVHEGVAEATHGAEVRTLDQLVTEAGLTRVDFIKIDVDGWEVDVFRGANEVLTRFKPTILMELAPYVLAEHGRDLGDLLGILTGAGYGFAELSERPIPDIRAFSRRVPDGAGVNVIARPSAKRLH